MQKWAAEGVPTQLFRAVSPGSSLKAPWVSPGFAELGTWSLRLQQGSWVTVAKPA